MDCVLPWFKAEFNGSKSWKFVNNEAPHKFEEETAEFGSKVAELNYESKFKKIVSENRILARAGKRMINFQGRIWRSSDLLETLAENWFRIFLRELDKMILKAVSVAVLRSSEERMHINETVYNFSGKEVNEEVLKGLSVGSNFVLHTSRGRNDATKKLNEEILDYLKKYRSVIERKTVILENDLMKWLEIAVEESNQRNEKMHHEFYSSVLRMLAISIGVGKKINDKSSIINFGELDQRGICVVEADKNVGICLVDIKDLLEADDILVNELGGQYCQEKDAIEIKESIIEQIKAFEHETDPEEKKFLCRFYGARMEEFEESVLPFLKVRPKLHKLSKEQLKSLDPKLLKYRPVVDSSRTPINPYAGMLTEYLRSLINRAEQRYMKEDSVFAKNGHDLAKMIRSLDAEDKNGMYFAIADLSSAYTYVFLKNLLVAMKFLGEKLGIPEWKSKLFLKIAELVFNNSFLETTKGVYKLNTCLPMGLCCSGESLDIVLMVCELVFLGKVNASEIEGFEQQFEKEKNKPESSLFTKYRRYRDDTCSVLKMNNEKDIKNSMTILGEAFLPELNMNIDASIFVGAFLDVMFFKRFGDGGYETTVKRKGVYPITFCHSTSNMSSSIVKSILGGELLRHRRLCSNEMLAETNDDCIVQELKSRGYKEEFVKNAVRKRIDQIKKLYDADFKLNQIKKAPDGLVYGAKSTYDEEWFTHEKLVMILRTSLPEGVR